MVACRHEGSSLLRSMQSWWLSGMSSTNEIESCHAEPLSRPLKQLTPRSVTFADYHAKLKHFTLSSAWGGIVTHCCLGLAAFTASCYADLVEEILGFNMHMPEGGHCYSRRCCPSVWHVFTLMPHKQCQVSCCFQTHSAVAYDSTPDDSLTQCVHCSGFWLAGHDCLCVCLACYVFKQQPLMVLQRLLLLLLLLLW